MNTRTFVSVLAVLALFVSGFVLTSGGSDAADGTWTDPNYRDPPSADYVIDITMDFSFVSSDPSYTYAISYVDAYTSGNVDGVSSDSQDDARSFLDWLSSFYYPDSGITWSDSYVIDGEHEVDFIVDIDGMDSLNGYSDACLPSWIDAYLYCDAEASSGNITAITDLGFLMVISPALQGLTEDTHGDYWVYYSITKTTDYWIGSDVVETKTFLIQFDVDVEYDGGVIVDPTENQVQLVIDYGDGDVREVVPVSIDEGQLSVTFRLPSSDEVPERDGYSFVGFSTEPNGDIIQSDTIAVLVSDLGPGEDGEDGTLYTFTIYAVWKKVDDGADDSDLTIPDPLRDLLELLSDPWVMLLVFVIVFGLAYLVRMRRIGGY